MLVVADCIPDNALAVLSALLSFRSKDLEGGTDVLQNAEPRTSRGDCFHDVGTRNWNDRIGDMGIVRSRVHDSPTACRSVRSSD